MTTPHHTTELRTAISPEYYRDLLGPGYQTAGSAIRALEDTTLVWSDARIDGDLESGHELLNQAADAWRELWGGFCFPLDGLLALATAHRGQPDEALRALDSILVDQPERSTWWDAELHRARAEVLALLGKSPADVIDELMVAADVARQQGATMFELLARRDQVNRSVEFGLDDSEALRALQEVLDRVSGDHPHVRDAKQLLESRR